MKKRRHMKVDKYIRNLLIKQSETRVLDHTRCMYFGNIYTYPKITGDEREVMVLDLQKLLEPKEYLIGKLKRMLGVK